MKRINFIKIFLPVIMGLALLFVFLVSTGLADPDREPIRLPDGLDTVAETGAIESTETILSPNVPQPPYSPSGTVKDLGANVEDGTAVKALCGGVIYAQTTTVNTLDPVESWYSLVIPADDPDTLDTKEGCQPLEEITFTIGETTAFQTVSFSPGSGLLELTTDEPAPAIDVEKMTNGEDADSPTGPALVVGSTVTWTLAVNNPGNVTLRLVDVMDDSGTTLDTSDDQLVCSFLRLKPNDPQNCSITGTVMVGQYMNQGLAEGIFNSNVYSDTDDSHYLGIQPALILEKLTNGVDADEAPGPKVIVGSPITWTYIVTNDGDIALESIHISDDNGTPGNLGDDVDICTVALLAPGVSDSCQWTGELAVLGPYGNVGTAETTLDDFVIIASDSSHYQGQPDMQYLFLPMITR